MLTLEPWVQSQSEESVEQGFLLQHSNTRAPCRTRHLLAKRSASYEIFFRKVGIHSDCTENAPRRGHLKTATPKFCDDDDDDDDDDNNVSFTGQR
jgi:hypothetical protein